MKDNMVKLKKNDPEILEYSQTLIEIKKRIKEAQTKAIFAVNTELLKLYWFIGKTIVEKQENLGWGNKVIDKLSADIQNAFLGIEGFSKSNIFRMRSFYIAYPIVAQPVRQLETSPIFMIPWGHIIVLLEKIKDGKERIWYAEKAIKNGWSRRSLSAYIESNLYKREGKAVTNFQKTLPISDSDMAQQTFKDPYLFDFLTLKEDYIEKDIEQGLIDHIQKFLLELGQGFAFVARQYHLEVANSDYYIDLLFYHFKLKCFIVIEIKAREFEPKDAGQLNFYLSAVDDLVRSKDDNATIGLLLCKTKNNIKAEYALRNMNSPMGVASYEATLQEKLPKSLKGSLPSIEEIEAEFLKVSSEEKNKKHKSKKANKE